MIPFVYAGTAGLVASIGAVGSQFLLPSADIPQNEVNKIKENESLNVNVSVRNNYAKMSSYARFSAGYASENAEIGISPYTTNINKVYAPIEFAKTDSTLFSNLILYHELSHTELNNMIKQREMPFKPQFDNKFDDISKAETGVRNAMNTEFYLAKQHKTFYLGNFHEQFADTYGSLLLIRNKSGEHSDEDIHQAIKSRYHAVKKQEEFLWGATGTLEHRTENSLSKVLDLDFNKIRAMSPSEVKELALKISSNASVEKFQAAYQTKFSPYLDKLDKESAETLKEMKVDNSFLDPYKKEVPSNEKTEKVSLQLDINKLQSLEEKHSSNDNNSLLGKLAKLTNFLDNEESVHQSTRQNKL